MSKSVKEMVADANASVPKLSPQEAHARMQQEEVLVVDTRDAPELQASGKIAGAVHASRGMLEFRADPESPHHNEAFDKDKPVFVYCASGGRSALAGKTLKEMGYTDVTNIGGFKDWQDAGLPVESV